MNEYRTEQHGPEAEYDIQRILGALWKRKWLIAVASAAFAVCMLLATLFLITPQYQSSAMFYVNNNAVSVGDATFSIDSGDISAAKSLVNSYIVILKTRESLNDVIDYAGVNRTYGEVKNMISAESVNSTEIFQVVITSPDPQEAKQLADAVAYILPKRISSIIEGTSAKVVDTAVLATRPSSPSYTANTFIGFVIGLLLSVCAVVVYEIFDITIRTEEDITQNCSHPVLAAVPDMTAASKGGYYSSYDTKTPKALAGGQAKQEVLVGGDISFAAQEAYKLLRTKLQFSFTDSDSCKVIGMSSALSGEGKSLTAVNLAFSLSELDKRVLLIDCDMRRPTVSVKLPVRKSPGLSDFLSAQCGSNDIFQHCGIVGYEDAFCVVSSGRNPPNPVELLSSDRMKHMIEQLREMFDYVILDLPPVGEVTDALAVSNLTDGILLVARQGHGNRPAFQSTVRQFEFVDARILGVVYNCATENTGTYSKRYYNKYNGNYAPSNERRSRSTNPKKKKSGHAAARKTER